MIPIAGMNACVLTNIFQFRYSKNLLKLDNKILASSYSNVTVRAGLHSLSLS